MAIYASQIQVAVIVSWPDLSVPARTTVVWIVLAHILRGGLRVACRRPLSA